MISKKIGPMTFSVKICRRSAAALGRRAVDQDVVLAEPRDILAVARQAGIDHLEIGVGGLLEAHAALAQALDHREDS